MECKMRVHRNVIRLFLPAFALWLSCAAALSQEKPLSAQQIVQRIQEHVGVPWHTNTVDTFKAGDPNAAVTGIAVTMMATLDVLQRAAASGLNLVITHEPTFYSHLDTIDGLPEKEEDPVLAAKREVIRKQGLVVWRFHDHWHERHPDGIDAGMTQALGWERFQDAENQTLFSLPETTLADLSADIQARLRIRVVRVVGDPALKVKRAALVAGAAGFEEHARVLEMKDVQALIIGEAREWETVEYVADAVTEGKPKGLIILGHIPSEQAGMEECARWLKTFVHEVPVVFVPAREPFWTPQDPPKASEGK
jgi:putative NIF3 family GTP cyclohydrolase 1 type 2